ncbi:unnamed protein product [Ectocarpus sp. 12 AP-2014]
MPNEDEALNISGCDDVAEAASFFLDRGVGLVVVTRGGGGAFAASRRHGGGGTAGGRGSVRIKGGGGGGAAGGGGDDGGGEGGFQRSWEQKCVPVEVVDTTGAGDAFSAGFLHVWVGGGDVQAALRWGCALGTAVVTRVGASSKLSIEEDVRPHLV